MTSHLESCQVKNVPRPGGGGRGTQYQITLKSPEMLVNPANYVRGGGGHLTLTIARDTPPPGCKIFKYHPGAYQGRVTMKSEEKAPE